MNMWLLLSLTIVTEVIGSCCLRASDGLTRWVPSIVMAVAYAITFYLLSLVLKQVPLGVTYAVWSGAGTALTAAIGWIVFKDSFHWGAACGIILIIAGVVVLNLTGGHRT